VLAPCSRVKKMRLRDSCGRDEIIFKPLSTASSSHQTVKKRRNSNEMPEIEESKEEETLRPA